MVIFEVEAADRLSAYLKTRHCYTDSRKGRYLRMAPFVWNTQAEIVQTFDLIEHALRTGAHLQATPEATGGPVT